ncbi:hypothetical protein M407DRAFT_19147 [Tulasnella calospora MUT 4182]|uniref:Uncharacterized protein n=1 Tax=Tulasnella calospora MUT 4182 TaxID=1051891 RepID=A0A0C3LD87_9AGAM|nr:hypothetical protein M407DRAFT_19147 [Tulasnella calospora MUT 4182]
MVPPIPARSTNKSKFAQNLTIRINKDPQTFEDWASTTLEDINDDHFWELQGPSMARKLQAMVGSWQDFIDTRKDVAEGSAFEPETFYRYACLFVRVKVENTRGRRTPDLVHWSTVESWLSCLIKVIGTFCSKVVDGVVTSLGPDLLRFGLKKGDTGLFVKLAQDAKLIFSKYSLDKWRPKKVYWTRYEVQMLVDEAFNTSASMEVALQTVLLITLAYVTSARVGAFGFSYKQWKKEGKYMKLQDIELFRDIKVPGAFEMVVHIKNVKGYNGTRGNTPLTMTLGSLKNPWNLFLEPAIPFIALLLHRGQFQKHTTLDSLLGGSEHQIVYKNPNDPLFYQCLSGGYGVDRTSPARSSDLTGQVVYLANKVGLIGSKESGGGSTKQLRTWGGEDLKNQLGETAAQQVLGHGAQDSVLNDNYARGVATLDMAALRAHEASEGNVQRAEEAMMRHVSRSPAVRARAVRIAQGQPVDGIDCVRFIQVGSDGDEEAPVDINVAKRTKVHTAETTSEIKEAVLADPELVAADQACSDAWERLRNLTNLDITQDQKGSNLKKGGKPGYLWLESEVDDEIPPEGATNLPEGWGTVAARKEASEDYTAARKARGDIRRRVQKRLSKGKTKELRNEYHKRLESNSVDDIATAISTLDAPSRTLKKVAATHFLHSAGASSSTSSRSPNATLVDDEDAQQELLLLAPADPGSETEDFDPYAHEDDYKDAPEDCDDAPEDWEDLPASEDPDEEFFNAQPGRLNSLEAKLRHYLREGTDQPQQKFDAKNRYSEKVLTSFDEERKNQLEKEGIGNVSMAVLRVRYFLFLEKLLKSDKASSTSLHGVWFLFSGFTCSKCRDELGPDVELKVYKRNMFLKHLQVVSVHDTQACADRFTVVFQENKPSPETRT